MKCPFCKADTGQMFRMLVKEHPEALTGDGPSHAGTLCVECGEPLFLTKTGFRKPTPEEYAEVATAPIWQMARLSFLEVKERDHKAIMHLNWLNFRDQALPDVLAHAAVPLAIRQRFSEVVELVFHCGAVSAIATVMQDVDRCDGRMHLDAILAIHKAELDALFSRLGYDVTGNSQRRRKHS